MGKQKVKAGDSQDGEARQMSANKAWDLYLCFIAVLRLLLVCLFSCHLSNEEYAEYVVFLSISILIIKKSPARMHAKSLQCVRLFATLWTVAHQALLSMGFSRQEYWSGLPFPFQGNFPTQGSNPGIKPRSPVLQADSLPTQLRVVSKYLIKY